VIGAHEQPASQRCASRQAVDPGDRVLVVDGRCGGQRKEFGERSKADGFHLHPWTVDAPQADLRPGDHAGQSKPTDRCFEQAIRIAATAQDTGSIAAKQFEAFDMVAEAAGGMVVLAVHVVGDRAADGDVAGARRDRHEPALRDHLFEDFAEQDTRFAAKFSRRRIEGDEAVQATRGKQGAAGVEATVAITAAVTVWQRCPFESGQRGVPVRHARDGVAGARVSPPGLAAGRYQIALATTTPETASNAWLVRSVTANTTGSSFISTRSATTETRLTQYSSIGHSSHRICGR